MEDNFKIYEYADRLNDYFGSDKEVDKSQKNKKVYDENAKK